MTRGGDVVVAGGGPIGLATAWQAARRGLAVVVVDPAPGSGASDVAAGMLAPVTEAHFGEERLLRLALESAARWPSFAAELEAAAEMSIGFRPDGTVVAAYDADDAAVLDDLYRYQIALGLDATWLRRREVRALEPTLNPAVRSGMLAAGDHRVDPRALVAALGVACERASVTIVREVVSALRVADGRAAGVELAGGSVIEAGAVVVAAGCWSAQIHDVPVRPVKGQILTLGGPPLLSRSVRGLVKGSSIYLVPRDDGRVVVGATMEERGWDTTVTAGGVYELLREATLLVPGISELAVVEVRAGLRPGSPDNAPMIGPASMPGLAVATGHGRNGILLTPATADAMAEFLASGSVPPSIDGLGADRFESAGVRA